MTVENKDKNNNEPRQLDDNDSLKKLTQELNEITNDNDKSNDEITGVFNQDLVESFDYTNFGIIPKLLEKIDGILDNSTLKLDDNTTNQLKDIKTLLQNRYDYILDDFSFSTTPVDFDFINSLSLENDIKTLFKDNNYKEIRSELIKKDKNGKEYILIKKNRFYIGNFGNERFYDHTNDNIILLDKGRSIRLGNANCLYGFDVEYDEQEIQEGNTKTIKFNNGQTLTISKDGDETIRSSNGIDLHGKLLSEGEHNNHYRFHSNDNPDLFLTPHLTEQKVLIISQILSDKKNTDLQCEITEDSTLKLGDSIYEINGPEDIKEISEWINNYKFDN